MNIIFNLTTIHKAKCRYNEVKCSSKSDIMESFELYLLRKSRLNRIKGYLVDYKIYNPIIMLIEFFLIIGLVYAFARDYFQITSILLAPLITITLIYLKEGHNLRNKENAISNAFIKELGRNLVVIRENLEIIRRDLQRRSNISSYIGLDPIYYLQHEIWNILKYNFPNNLVLRNINSIEKFIFNSFLLNELIKKRDIVGMTLHVPDNQYYIGLNNIERVLLTRLESLQDSLQVSLDEMNIVIIKEVMDSEEIEKLFKDKFKYSQEDLEELKKYMESDTIIFVTD